MVDLTRFVPDADLPDLEAAKEFMLPGGQITGRRLTDPAESAQRDRSYETLRAHGAERERLLSSASIEAEDLPIGEALGGCAGTAIGPTTTRLVPNLAMRMTPHLPNGSRIPQSLWTIPGQYRPSSSWAGSRRS